MQNGIHFISGLPRSGSTLLSAILRQNPRFHAGMSTLLGPLFSSLQSTLSGRNEYHVFIDDEKRAAMLRGIFTGYYENIHDQKMVFDTNRTWTSKVHALHMLYPKARFICCVRPLCWVLDSLERLVQRNALEPSRMFNYDAVNHVYKRVEMLVEPNGLVMGPYNSLRDAYYGEHANKLILVNFDSLTAKPQETIAAIYEFLEEPAFSHDFNNIEFDADEFDARIGTKGLHRVGKSVQPVKRRPILPPDIFHKFEKSDFWNIPTHNPRGVRII